MMGSGFGDRILPLGDGGTTVTPTTGTTGWTSRAVPFGAANGTLTQDPTGFVWDSTQDALGIGTSTPQAGIHVVPVLAPPVITGTSNFVASINVAGGNTTAPTFGDTVAARFANVSMQGSTVSDGAGLTIRDAQVLYVGAAPTTGTNTSFTRVQSILVEPGANGSTAALGIVVRRSTGSQANAFEVQSTAAGTAASITAGGNMRAADGTVGSIAGFGFQGEVGLGIRRDRAGFMMLGTSNSSAAGAADCKSVITLGSSGTTMQLGFFSTVTVSRPTGFATTGTSGRTMNSTNIPAAVYSSAVGAQLNALQAVVKCLVKDLSAGVGYGLLPTTV